MPSALLKQNVMDSNILPHYIQRHRVKRSMPLWNMLSDTQQAGQGIVLCPKKGRISFAIYNFFGNGEVFSFYFLSSLFFFFISTFWKYVICF